MRAVRSTEERVEELPPQVQLHPQEAMWLEIADHEPTIRAALVANGVQPMICQQKGREQQRDYRENVKRLQQLCKERGRRLILVGPPGQPSEPAPTAATAKSKK